jgi:hypothetical protein
MSRIDGLDRRGSYGMKGEFQAMTTVYTHSLTAFHIRMCLLNAYSAHIEPEADPFEERCQRILRKLRGWIFRRYGGEYLDDMVG